MEKPPFSHQQIRELLPHRYPILLVDRVLELNENQILAQKLVSANEPWLQGHFPNRPIMPGVLILEAMAQTAGVQVLFLEPHNRGRDIALLSIHKARFRQPVQPGDVLDMSAHPIRRKGDFYRYAADARVDGNLVAEVEFTAAYVDWEVVA